MSAHIRIILIGIIFLIIISFPYLVAANMTGDSVQFSGFLINPIDGNSYLAKMYQGYAGEWLFTLPYTPDHENGAFLFEFYLLLGHFSRLSGLSLLAIFHAARVLSAGLFFIVLIRFLKKTLLLPEETTFCVAVLACFGSGLGWFFSFLGAMTSDFWVAEAYPFLSANTNPHFILGMAGLLWLLTFIREKAIKGLVITWFSGLLVSIIMPFAAVLAGIIYLADGIWSWYETKRVNIRPLTAILAGAGISITFQYWQTLSDPFLAGWNAQNITPTPPAWDMLISFSPALFLAVAALIKMLKGRRLEDIRIPLLWAGCSIFLMIIPFTLQRRFIFGLFIPLSILAVEGVYLIAQAVARKPVYLFTGFLMVSVLTNLLLLISGLGAVSAGNNRLLLYRDEIEAFAWIENNTDRSDIILCSPLLGNILPAYTGRQVLYGHPFETLHSEQMEKMVTEFFAATWEVKDRDLFIEEYQVDLIIVGPRELELGQANIPETFPILFQNGSVTIFEASEGP